jgi:hypothetical protein
MAYRPAWVVAWVNSPEVPKAWEGLLQLPPAAIAAALVDESLSAYVYRRCSVFIGVLWRFDVARDEVTLRA